MNKLNLKMVSINVSSERAVVFYKYLQNLLLKQLDYIVSKKIYIRHKRHENCEYIIPKEIYTQGIT